MNLLYFILREIKKIVNNYLDYNNLTGIKD